MEPFPGNGSQKVANRYWCFGANRSEFGWVFTLWRFARSIDEHSRSEWSVLDRVF